VKKRILILMFMIGILVPNYKVKATTLGDLYNDLSALEKSYNASKNKANMSQAELNNVKASITSIENEIQQSQKNIEKAEKEIKESEEKIKQKKEETNQMLLYLQLSDGQSNSLLEYVFAAETYTDFIYRYSVITQMSDYNQDLLDELNKLINDLTTKKANLAKEQKNLTSKKTELQSKYAIIQSQYEEEQESGLSVAQQISEKKKVIKHYESLGCTKTQNINTCGIKTSSSSGSSSKSSGGSSSSAASGWVYPLSSFTQYSNYGNDCTPTCRLHYAVDLSTPEGSNVYAVRSGTVWSITTSTCGGRVVQILHEYNGSNYISLYMHLLSSNVSRWDTVSAGQIIGKSGGGPKEAAAWGDTCSQGAHLHFAMSSGASLIGKSSEKGSTFNPVKFFPAMRGYGASL
jgi:murein DD-endopeptidase MepM/ murein hydrolase activator NlpD